MRTDYILYVVAVICFVIAVFYGATYQLIDNMSNVLIVTVLAIIAAVFALGGYSLRPQKPVVTTKPSMPPTKSAIEEQPPLPIPEPATTPEPEPQIAPAPEPETETMPTPEPIPEPTLSPEQTEEAPPPESLPETKKPARKRRERRKT